MLAATPSGLHNTPFTKGSLIVFGLASLYSQVFKSGQRFDLFLPKIIPGNQFYRIFTSNLAFSTSSELFLGILLLYNFRIIERHWGTAKVASITVITLLLSSCLNILILSAAPKLISRISSGPFGLIMSLAVFYSLEVPTSYHLKVVGVKVSDHIFLSLLLLQFSVLSGISSILPSVTGLISGGTISYFKLLGEWRIPRFIQRLASSYLLPLVQSKTPPKLTTSTSPMDSRAGHARQENTAPSTETAPEEEDIVLLESMGFQRDRVVEALRISSNDVNRAIAFLLG